MIPVVVSSAIFIITLILIFAEKIHRTSVALVGAAAMMAAGLFMGFYTQDAAVRAIDFDTLGLLLGMMVLVALLEPTGFFQYLAVLVGKMSKGRPLRLLILLGTVTTIISLFLNNVTTVVLVAPVTILICEILGLNPQPYLLAEALLSDTGGVATLVGDPPNILIASAAGFSFNDFLVYSLPIVAVSWIVALWLLQRLFKDDLKPSEAVNVEAIQQLNPIEALKEPATARKALVVVGFAVILFLLGDKLGTRPAFIAMSAAGLGLVWVQPDVSATLKRVEWDILLFFAALFVLVGGMEQAGTFKLVTNLIAGGIHLPMAVLGVILLWVVALLSAVIDNVPITIALIPVLQGLAASGVDITPLWWALVFGAGFGGNGTIIGSTANVVVTGLSGKTRHPITPVVWSKRGLPVMLATCVIASILFVVVTLTTGWK